MTWPPSTTQRWLALALTGALAVGGSATALLVHRDRGSSKVSLLSAPVAPAATAPASRTPALSVPPPPPATAAPPVPPATPVRRAPALVDPGLPARCAGPLPPGQPSDPSCDALHPHPGLPHPCLGPRNACAWPDAHGAVPGGPSSTHATVQGSTLHVVWASYDLAGNTSWGPVRSFVIRLLRTGSDVVVLTRVLPTGERATDLLDVPPGTYDVQVQELNDSGLSAGLYDSYTVAAPPPPSPSRSAAPSPTPSPGSTPAA